MSINSPALCLISISFVTISSPVALTRTYRPWKARTWNEPYSVLFKDWTHYTLSPNAANMFEAINIHPRCKSVEGVCIPRNKCKYPNKMLYISRVCYKRDFVCCYDNTIYHPVIASESTSIASKNPLRARYHGIRGHIFRTENQSGHELAINATDSELELPIQSDETVSEVSMTTAPYYGEIIGMNFESANSTPDSNITAERSDSDSTETRDNTKLGHELAIEAANSTSNVNIESEKLFSDMEMTTASYIGDDKNTSINFESVNSTVTLDSNVTAETGDNDSTGTSENDSTETSNSTEVGQGLAIKSDESKMDAKMDISNESGEKDSDIIRTTT